MTCLQEIAINNIIRSAVSIQHDFRAPYYDGANSYQRQYHRQNGQNENEWKREYRRKQRETLQINPKWKKCYGG